MDELTNTELYDVNRDDLIDYIVELRARLLEAGYKMLEKKLNENN